MLAPSSPSLLSLPFPSWRTFQPEAITAALMGLQHAQVYGLSSPVGSGKTAIALAIARIYAEAGMRVAILTATKGLQEQYLTVARDLADVRGAGNYPCRGLRERIFPPHVLKRFWQSKAPMCDDAPCHEKYECRYRDGGCDYWDRVEVARRKGRIVLTNYDYFILGPLGDFDLVIGDEGHEMEKVLDRVAVIDVHDMPRVPDLRRLVTWAREEVTHLPNESASEAAFERRVRRVAAIKDPDNYVLTEEGFQPIHLTHEATALSSKASRLLLMSGTLTRGMVERFSRMTGMTWSFSAYPSTFPVDSRRLLVWPVQRMGRKSAEDYTWVKAVDRIIESEGGLEGVKGIIHTVSYDRAKSLKERSQYGHLMLLNTPRTTMRVVEEFKSAKRGVLVSPSVGTGYDFPYEECRFQVITKAPFPNPTNPLVKARMSEDKTYASGYAIAEIAQMLGRGTRAQDDFCRTWAIDSMVPGLIWNKAHEDLVPQYVKEAYTRADLGSLN